MSYLCQETGCGRTFASTQARNGHMATHRVKPVAKLTPEELASCFKPCGRCAACLSSDGEACERQSDWPCSFCKRPFGSLREVNAHERKCEIENIAAWEKKISFAALEAEVIHAAEKWAVEGSIVQPADLALRTALAKLAQAKGGNL